GGTAGTGGQLEQGEFRSPARRPVVGGQAVRLGQDQGFSRPGPGARRGGERGEPAVGQHGGRRGGTEDRGRVLGEGLVSAEGDGRGDWGRGRPRVHGAEERRYEAFGLLDEQGHDALGDA